MKVEKIKEKYKLEFIGTVKLGSQIYVSDPCYDVNTWCQYQLQQMKNQRIISF